MRRQEIQASAPPNRDGTIGALRREIAVRLAAVFREAGRGGTPDLDAKVLVAAAARIDPASLSIRADTVADEDMTRRARTLADRRARGEPVARIVGRKEFWGLDLAVAPATLVPRPDTETVVEAALAFAARAGRGVRRILDLGTGSGAILLALLSELPDAVGVGTDIAPGAARIAAENAARLGLARRAAFVVGNWTAPLAAGAFDLVVANPPYIPSGDIAGLDVEVRDHDPRRALDGGADGLAAVRLILGDLRRVLAPGAGAFVEIGAGQRDRVAALAADARFGASFIADLAGVDRVAALAF